MPHNLLVRSPYEACRVRPSYVQQQARRERCRSGSADRLPSEIQPRKAYNKEWRFKNTGELPIRGEEENEEEGGDSVHEDYACPC